eukprot:TRINITY_DN22475_c0_g1_i1.p1 TRINITY_DN22475_c0_g1~~TRINITY_DN22475_c0_g1_i1.p1  ORF type:complete len:632 (+),score=105.36 TRINITY_DN22475_c0_g1_i1:53-1948(+)
METQLQAAVQASNIATVRALLEKGVPANGRDSQGLTPLLLALQVPSPTVAVVRLLLEFKADCSAADSDGRTAVHYAASRLPQTGIDGVGVFSTVIERARPDQLLALDSKKRTALHALAEAGDLKPRGAPEAVHRYLSKATAEVLQDKDAGGEAPLESAVRCRRPLLAQVLLQHLHMVEPPVFLEALAVFSPEWGPVCAAMAHKLTAAALIQDHSTAAAILEGLCPDNVLLLCGPELFSTVLLKLTPAELHAVLRHQAQESEVPVILYAMAYNNYPLALALIEALPASSPVLQAIVRPELASRFPNLVGKTALQMAAELAEMIIDLERASNALGENPAFAVRVIADLGLASHGVVAGFHAAGSTEFNLRLDASRPGVERSVGEMREFMQSLISFVQSHHAALVKAILFRVAPPPTASPIELPRAPVLPAVNAKKARNSPSPALTAPSHLSALRSKSPMKYTKKEVERAREDGEVPPAIRMSRPELDDMVSRLYVQSVEQKKQRQQKQEAATYQYAAPQTLPPDKIQELATRLCNESLEKNRKAREDLRAAAYKAPPPRTVSPDQLGEVVGRLYDGPLQRKKEQLEKLEAQYTFTRTHFVAKPEQVKSTVERLYRVKQTNQNDNPMFYATHGI